MTTTGSGSEAHAQDALANEAQLWHELHALIDGLSAEEAERPGYYVEGWNAKDAIAHIGTWMAQGAQMLERIRAGTYREGELDVDAENARFYAAMKDVALDTVHLQTDSARAALLRAWGALVDRMTPEADFWVRKAGPEHIDEHLPRLREWVTELRSQKR